MKNRIRLMALMAMVLVVMVFTGCGRKPAEQPESAGSAATVDLSSFMESSDEASSEDSSAGADEMALVGTSAEAGEAASEDSSAESDEASAVTTEYTAHIEPLLDEDGTYTTKADVALYIHTYGKLPSNFMTKKQAKKLGWSGGSLEDFAPGMCIGGDYFGNYEGLLPEDKEYHECDIDTLGKKSRGAKRIIYSDDGYIYYTEDHYESFEQLYGE
ncbi:ribonuclease domain-containing protein [Butyrivibrio sp.]|uniref:ribonuclease domain-containing protein n=1 Tax=Butyrivibrio sp. TaxID=28121 RepID=UPI0025BF8212|nr:ribonuclease domain-containing protein [Butyrivibrio sp.]